MTLTHFPYGVSSFGVPVMGGGGIPATFGKVFFVDGTDGSSAYSGENTTEAKALLSQAYALCTTGDDDVIVLRGEGTIDEDEMITWSKDKIHVIGVGGHGATDPEPRLRFSATGIAADNSAAVLKVTGWGNSFSNFRIVSWGTNAASVTALWDAGEASVYNNMQFCKFTDLGGGATISDVEARGDSTTWRNCKFGFDTLVQTSARPTMLVKGVGGARMKNNYFEDCYFVCSSSSATKRFIKLNSGPSLGFSNVMRNPVFLAAVVGSLSSAVLDDCIEGHASASEGNLLVVNPATNCDSICTVSAVGIQVVGPLTHVNAGYPQTPS